MKSIFQMADAIKEIEDELIWLRRENARLRVVEERYNELLDSSVRHAQNNAAGLIGLLMLPGVGTALSQAAVANRNIQEVSDG